MTLFERRDPARTGLRGIRVLIPAGLPAIFAAGLALAAIPAPATAAPEDPVAVVGGETITEAEFESYLQRYVRSKLYHGGSPERLRELANEALDEMVDDLLLSQAAEARGLKGDPAQVAKRMDALREQYQDSETWAQIQPVLPLIEEDLLSKSKVEELRGKVTRVGEPGDAEVRAFYASKPELFTQPAANDVNLILVGVPPSALTPEWDAADARATELVAELRGGADFEETAKANSAHSSAQSGGAVGRIHDGQLPDAAGEAMAKLKEGEISDAIRLLEGFLIVRLNTHYPAQLQPYDKVKERAGKLYVRHTAEQNWTDFVANLRSSGNIKRYGVEAQVKKFTANE